jgi:quercetin dioxygenase-like cupin family protein
MHFHRENVEAFYVISGRLNLIVSDKTYSFAKGDMFRIPPGVGHSLDFVEDTLLVSMYSLGVDLPDGTRDIVEI